MIVNNSENLADDFSSCSKDFVVVAAVVVVVVFISISSLFLCGEAERKRRPLK